MTRAVRATRGAAGALSATLFAAASHALAGGAITGFAVVASAILALPLCTALAGRVGSLWRLALAVVVSQFVFHWSFSGLGIASGAAVDGAAGESTPAGSHEAHLAALHAFAPTLVSTGLATSGTAMWAGHAVAAAATIALLHRGERAFLRLVRLIRRALPTAAPRPVRLARAERPEPAAPRAVAPLFDRLLASATISHRGPPAAAVRAGC
ncbi:hypothetical protein D3248_06570 [Leucobacter zeae]|nr:hypothetical protein [Leucobacter zeae]